MLSAFLSGVALCLGLCMVFGPQNIFVMRTGLERKNRWAVILTCFFCEFAVLMFSTFGVGAWIQKTRWLLISISIGGMLFLAYYGGMALRNVIANKYSGISSVDEDEDSRPRNRIKMAILAAFAVSSLNPDSLKDTMIIIPGIAAGYDDQGKLMFLAGHLSTIFIWFSSLCFAASKMRKLFMKPIAWRILDALVFVMMTYLCVQMAITTLDYF